MSLVLLTLLSSYSAWAVQLSDCRQAYDLRIKDDQALYSTQCFRQWLLENPSADPENKNAATRDLFLSLAWNYTHQTKFGTRRDMVNEGKTRSQQMIEQDVTAGDGYYWKAVFNTFDCQLIDGNRGIPRCFMNRKNMIIDLLFKAMKFEPTVHGYGPSSIYGIMMREMPKIVGGNKAVSLRYLKESFEKDPSFSSNHIEYAKTLFETGYNTDAVKLLRAFIVNDCRTMDPKRIYECEEDHITARAMLQ